jgi:hypothetical protein
VLKGKRGERRREVSSVDEERGGSGGLILFFSTRFPSLALGSLFQISIEIYNGIYTYAGG